RHAASLVGDQSIWEHRITAADDMSRYLQMAPGCYFWLGAADAAKGPQTLHQPNFAFDEGCLALGLELALRVVQDYLSAG
ncbi:MAG: amidohydrolase, partial [Dehalococcoidia bacterium]